MCTSTQQDKDDCAAHTRPRYQTAPFGTAAWDEAAATTPGRSTSQPIPTT